MEQYIIPGSIAIVGILTVLIIGGMWLFGRFLFNTYSNYFEERVVVAIREALHAHNHHDINRYLNSWTNYLKEFLERRNEFWTTYGQMIICIFIVAVLSILLLTKTITAEAGLPILSAISGFAIAKGSNMRNSNTDNFNNDRG